MKRSTLLIFALAGFLFSCSNSDESETEEPIVVKNYFPLASPNYWTYNITAQNTTDRDSLYISNDTVINAESYKKFKTRFTPTGFFSGSVNNNGVRNENGKLLLSGSAGLNLGDALPVDLSLTDFVLLDENGADGQQLSSVSGTLQQDFQGFPLTIQYTLKSSSVSTLPTFSSPNGVLYNNVKSVKIVLTLSINTSFSGFPITLLPTQDVVTTTQYYADNVGMVYANTDITYQLADLSLFQIDLPFPESDSQNQKEFLDDYHVELLFNN